MHIRLITFGLDGITAEENAPAAAAMAPAFAAWPGLHTKFWIANEGATTLGGVYVFADRESADASRRTAEFAAVADNPHYRNLTIEEFDVIDPLTAITAGPFGPVLASRARS